MTKETWVCLQLATNEASFYAIPMPMPMPIPIVVATTKVL